MAYYDALIAKWGTLTGTTQQKLDAINAATVTLSTPKPAILSPSDVINAIVPADLASLTTAQVTLLGMVLSGSTVDASAGTTVRAAVAAIFSGKTTTLSQLSALVSKYDNPVVPWWQATVAQGGGGLVAPVQPSDLAAAGGLT